jgi:hypothetical protein
MVFAHCFVARRSIQLSYGRSYSMAGLRSSLLELVLADAEVKRFYRKQRRHQLDVMAEKSTIEHYPSGSVVARVFLTANPSVYAPVQELIAHC